MHNFTFFSPVLIFILVKKYYTDISSTLFKSYTNTPIREMDVMVKKQEVSVFVIIWNLKECCCNFLKWKQVCVETILIKQIHLKSWGELRKWVRRIKNGGVKWWVGPFHPVARLVTKWSFSLDLLLVGMFFKISI